MFKGYLFSRIVVHKAASQHTCILWMKGIIFLRTTTSVRSQRCIIIIMVESTLTANVTAFEKRLVFEVLLEEKIKQGALHCRHSGKWDIVEQWPVGGKLTTLRHFFVSKTAYIWNALNYTFFSNQQKIDKEKTSNIFLHNFVLWPLVTLPQKQSCILLSCHFRKILESTMISYTTQLPIKHSLIIMAYGTKLLNGYCLKNTSISLVSQ